VHDSQNRPDTARATLPDAQKQVMLMFPPKDFLDAIGSKASRLFNGETPLPRAQIEAQLKGIVQGALSKLDVVSRDEFDSQMVVLARTRARLEALEAKVAELEEKLAPPASE
jgi:ubiquinone biosynthesis accessory factor UbiK